MRFILKEKFFWVLEFKSYLTVLATIVGAKGPSMLRLLSRY